MSDSFGTYWGGMVKVTKEGSLEHKGVRNFKLDVRDAIKDKAVHQAGVRSDSTRLNGGSFAKDLFSQLFAQPAAAPRP